MAFCPNCSAELGSPRDLVCENCEARFDLENGWHPTAEPVGKFIPRVKKPPRATEPVKKESVPQSPRSKVLRWVLATPLFLLGAWLIMFVAAARGPIVAIALAGAFLCAGTGLFVLRSRPGLATVLSAIMGIALLLAAYFVLMVLAAITSR